MKKPLAYKEDCQMSKFGKGKNTLRFCLFKDGSIWVEVKNILSPLEWMTCGKTLKVMKHGNRERIFMLINDVIEERPEVAEALKIAEKRIIEGNKQI